MADNSLRTPGTGETIASDDIAGVKWQRMKIGLGPDGTADDMLGNTQGSLLASAARTAAVTGANQTNYNARGVIVTLNISVASGTGGLTIRILGVIGGAAFWLNAAPPAIITPGPYSYEVYPGASTAGSAGANTISQRTAGALPRIWRVDVAVGDASSYTYALDYALII